MKFTYMNSRVKQKPYLKKDNLHFFFIIYNHFSKEGQISLFASYLSVQA